MVMEAVIGAGGFLLGLAAAYWFVRPSPKSASRSALVGEEGLAYIKGVNYILSDSPDQAIEEFIKAVQINSETVETYLALGSLFRAKGDVHRAIRIHQGIICRPHLDPKIMIQALFHLGLDYRKAGLLDRAVETFQQVVEKDPKMLQAYLQLEALYEETQDWEAAYQTQQRISKLRKTDDRNILSHLLTEMGKTKLEQGDRKGAEKCFKKAISVHSACVDAYLHMGDLYAEEGKDAKAVEMWKRILDVAPPFIFLAFDRLERAFFRMGKVDELERILRDRSSADRERDYVSGLYLGRHLLKKGAAEEAERIFRELLDRWPKDREARRGLIRALRAQGKNDAALEEYERMLLECLQEGHWFRCRMCGYRGARLTWKCPQCHRWDTLDPEWQVDAGEGSSG